MSSLWLAHAAEVASDDFAPGARFDAVVLGAGLTGLVTAVLLARAGKKVAVLEAREVGAVATGHTTAKLSLLHGAKLAPLVGDHGLEVARAYVDANRAGQQWLLKFCEEQSVTVETRDAFTYTAEPGSSGRLNEELRACRAVGLDVEGVETPELPFLTYGAVRLRDQFQFDPVEVSRALVRAFREAGGRIFTGLRALSIEEGPSLEVTTDRGGLFAPDVVIATGFPAFDQHLLFARLEAHRSYALAVQVDGDRPQGMYLSVDHPARSLRTARVAGQEYLLIGGNGHIVGREQSAKEHVADLLAWTHKHFGNTTLLHSWSAQDYRTLDGLPLIASWRAGKGRAFFATGYDKWGMTNGAAAGLALVGRVLDRGQPRWAPTLYERPGALAPAAGRAFSRNGKVALEMARGWRNYLGHGGGRPAEGQGVILRDGITPVGLAKVDGRTHRISAVCTHLGGVLHWNDAERSWDCPLHGSRFSVNGDILEGPANCPLKKA